MDPSAPGVLRTAGLGVTYGGVQAVSDVSLSVGRGELVGLIGPNGAGKTTTIDAISGFVEHRGSVLLHDTDLSSAPPHERVRAGLARTWQAVECFDDLTVREHLDVARSRGGVAALLADAVRFRRARSADDEVDRILELLDLGDVASSVVTDLPHGTQKLVGVARAMATGPSAILLDEPAAGLDAAEGRRFATRLRSMAESGTAVLLVDHDVELVMHTCDRLIVLDFGAVIAEGVPEQVRSDPRVQAAYLGTAPIGIATEPVGEPGSASPGTASS